MVALAVKRKHFLLNEGSLCYHLFSGGMWSIYYARLFSCMYVRSRKDYKRNSMRLLLSCISTKHSTLKKHWSDTGQQTACPLTTLGSRQKPDEDLGGLLCLIEDFG